MAGLADFTFFSELKYPTILHEDTFTATSSGVAILKTGVPTDVRVVAWGVPSTSTMVGGGYIANSSIYVSPSGELRMYMLEGAEVTYRIYAR